MKTPRPLLLSFCQRLLCIGFLCGGGQLSLQAAPAEEQAAASPAMGAARDRQLPHLRRILSSYFGSELYTFAKYTRVQGLMAEVEAAHTDLRAIQELASITTSGSFRVTQAFQVDLMQAAAIYGQDNWRVGIDAEGTNTNVRSGSDLTATANFNSASYTVYGSGAWQPLSWWQVAVTHAFQSRKADGIRSLNEQILSTAVSLGRVELGGAYKTNGTNDNFQSEETQSVFVHWFITPNAHVGLTMTRFMVSRDNPVAKDHLRYRVSWVRSLGAIGIELGLFYKQRSDNGANTLNVNTMTLFDQAMTFRYQPKGRWTGGVSYAFRNSKQKADRLTVEQQGVRASLFTGYSF